MCRDDDRVAEGKSCSDIFLIFLYDDDYLPFSFIITTTQTTNSLHSPHIASAQQFTTTNNKTSRVKIASAHFTNFPYEKLCLFPCSLFTLSHLAIVVARWLRFEENGEQEEENFHFYDYIFVSF